MANRDTLPPTAAPDPALNYERADPRNESPAGTLDRPAASPVQRPDRMEQVVPQRQDASRHMANADEAPGKPLVPEDQIEGDMTTEEPQGWDQVPTDIHDPKHQRHPRPDGLGAVKQSPKSGDPL